MAGNVREVHEPCQFMCLVAFDNVLRALRSSDGGMRLAGYAYAYSKADSPLLPPVIDALSGEETRFNQYWALNAIDRITARGDLFPVPDATIARLRKLADSLPDTSKLHLRMTELLNRID